MTTPLESLFQKKFDEFCTDLEGACPELQAEIRNAKQLTAEDKLRRFCDEVTASPQRDTKACPGCVLPGVTLTTSIWNELSEGSQKAIQEYLTLLTMCSYYESNRSFADLSGQEGFLKDFLENWRTKLGSTDFSGLADRFAKFLESTAGQAGTGGAPGLGSLPERFLRGHIARLAEDLVREFRPEDFGLSAEELQECERNPGRAFEMLLQAYTTRPEVLQTAMQKIASRMQQKIQRGELRPQDLAAEAEELIKECSDNPAFREMMESIRNVFGFEDMDMARAQGREGSARMSIVRNRLRAKLEKRKGGKK